MKFGTLATAAGVMVFMFVPFLVAASFGWAIAPSQSAPSWTPQIEVGKTYAFGVSGSDVTGKVLAGPRGNWLQIEVQDGDNGQTAWLNLQQVSYISPDPPKRSSRPCCSIQSTPGGY